MPVDFVSIQDAVYAARRNLDQSAWDYLSGGSESETTLRRNRQGFDRLGLRHRVLIDVSHVDTTTTLLGYPMRIPVMLAPVGGLQRFTPEGSVASARAAKEFGALHTVSSAAEPGLEAVAESCDYPKMFQLYIRGDWDWTAEMIGRIKKAGYVALCICVDNPVLSRRERVMIGRPQAARPAQAQRWGAMVTWDMLDRIKSAWGGPLMVKGIATAEDASLAVQHGVEVIWVSNHGGRQLDYGQSTIEVLPEVVEAAGGKAEIVLDGGIQRSTDIVKALALGARAVAIGKVQGWALGAGGQEGMVRVFELLEEELSIDMALLGVTSIGQLGPSYVCKSEPVTAPHEMSGWVNLQAGRLL